MIILVTGGTGTLGRTTVPLLAAAGHELRVFSRHPGPGHAVGDLDTGAGLAAAGHELRVFSRHPGPGHAVGDLDTGAGLAEAVAGADVVLHMSMGGAGEDAQTARLLAASREAGVGHLLYVSIVGVDRNREHPYYGAKYASEEAIESGAVPWTIVRVAQFHDFIVNILRRQPGPDYAVSAFAMQPIATEEVAERLVELVAAGPAGRVDDLNGPEQGTLAGFARQWLTAHGAAAEVTELDPADAAARNMQRGTQLGTLPGYGRGTFAEFAARRATDAADADAATP